MFLPVYLNTIGMNKVQIGILMALSPAMAVVLPPFIGMYADRSPTKNRVLLFLTAGAAVAAFLYPLATDFWYLVAVGLFLAVFQSAQGPLSEAITLEGLAHLGKSYGPVRLAGTFGFAVAALVVGPLLKIDVRFLFFTVGAMALLNLVTAWRLPVVKGHQTGTRVPVSHVFHDKSLTIMLGFSLVANLAIQFYNSFFAVYFVSLGGSPDQVGFLLALMAVSELPFLLWAEKILAKVGLRGTLVLSMGVVVLRFAALAVLQAPGWLFALSLLNGLTFIVFAYSLATYIAKNVRKELRATGQTFLGVASAAGRTLGSLGGGLLAQTLGLATTFVLMGALGLVATAVFLWVTRDHANINRPTT
jgi:PPP family 3-phenylpropionic acid transporter